MGKFKGADVWADNADDGAGLRRREERDAAREAGDFASLGKNREVFVADPMSPNPDVLATAEALLKGSDRDIEVIGGDYFKIKEADPNDTDPNSVLPHQEKMIVEINTNHEGDNAQLVGADRKLTKVQTAVPLKDVEFRPQTNFIPAIKTTKTPEVKPWSKPAPEKSFFKRLFGG
jgi:hypothetical protein